MASLCGVWPADRPWRSLRPPHARQGAAAVSALTASADFNVSDPYPGRGPTFRPRPPMAHLLRPCRYSSQRDNTVPFRDRPSADFELTCCPNQAGDRETAPRLTAMAASSWKRGRLLAGTRPIGALRGGECAGSTPRCALCRARLSPGGPQQRTTYLYLSRPYRCSLSSSSWSQGRRAPAAPSQCG